MSYEYMYYMINRDPKKKKKNEKKGLKATLHCNTNFKMYQFTGQASTAKVGKMKNITGHHFCLQKNLQLSLKEVGVLYNKLQQLFSRVGPSYYFK